jgi:hypothetical protein
MPKKFKRMQLAVNSIVIRNKKRFEITNSYKKIQILPTGGILTGLLKSKKIKGKIRYITINYLKN